MGSVMTGFEYAEPGVAVCGGELGEGASPERPSFTMLGRVHPDLATTWETVLQPSLSQLPKRWLVHQTPLTCLSAGSFFHGP